MDQNQHPDIFVVSDDISLEVVEVNFGGVLKVRHGGTDLGESYLIGSGRHGSCLLAPGGGGGSQFSGRAHGGNTDEGTNASGFHIRFNLIIIRMAFSF